MKVKAAKKKDSNQTSLVLIKKTKADIKKTKKPAKDLKPAAVKTVASNVALPAPLTFAEKKVLSVKRKSKSKKKVADSLGKTQGSVLLAKSKTEKKEPKKHILDEPDPLGAIVLPDPEQRKAVRAEKAFLKKLKKQEREAGGPIAKVVTEDTLALVPKELISKESFQKCFETLRKKVGEQGNKLFGDDLKYGLQIISAKIPQVPSRNCRVSLPFPVLREVDEICLIVKDLKRGRGQDYENTLNSWEDTLQALDIPLKIQVMPFQQLKRDYGSYEMKRKFVHRYERFLVDGRISGHVFAVLGSHFARRCKNPIPVKLDKQDKIKERIEQAILLQTYRRNNLGTTTDIKFAAHWMPVEQAVENGMALLEKLKTIFPGGYLNILSVHLTTACDKVHTMPIYVSTIDPNLIPTPFNVGPRQKFIEKQKLLMQKRTDGAFEVTDEGVVRKARKPNENGEYPENSDEDLIMDEYDNERDDDWLPYDDEPNDRERSGFRRQRGIKMRTK